jgi:hypothetical protein
VAIRGSTAGFARLPPLASRGGCAKFFAVSKFFRPNIQRHGRIARGVIGALCLIAGIILVDYVLWLGLIFVVAGLFAIYEALSGWCLARACGIKTKI